MVPLKASVYEAIVCAHMYVYRPYNLQTRQDTRLYIAQLSVLKPAMFVSSVFYTWNDSASYKLQEQFLSQKEEDVRMGLLVQFSGSN